MRTIIAGSRSITDMELLLKTIKEADQNGLTITTILCGGANGVDTLGREWAKKHNIPIEYYPANWDKHGKRAGYVRNQEMVHNAEALIAIWDGKSKGTEHTIDLAQKANLKTYLINTLPSAKETLEKEEQGTPHKRKKGKKIFRLEKHLTPEGAQKRRDKLEAEILKESKWHDDWGKYEKENHAKQALENINHKKNSGGWMGHYYKDYEYRIKTC